MVKYVVEIGYREYEFDDLSTATSFAEIAATHQKDKENDVIVRFKEEEEEC